MQKRKEKSSDNLENTEVINDGSEEVLVPQSDSKVNDVTTVVSPNKENQSDKEVPQNTNKIRKINIHIN